MGNETKRSGTKNPEWAGGSIDTTVTPEAGNGENGWWLITATFKGRTTVFRAFYPDGEPTGRRYFEDLAHTLYVLKKDGPLKAIVWAGGGENNLSVQESLDALAEAEKNMRYLLGPGYYREFENCDDKFFTVFVD